MGFQSVYSSLLDLFPQVDPRALKAVAIEHSKDVDTAVIAVLEEIIPFLTEKPTPSSPLSQSFSISESSNVDTQKEDCPLVETGGLVQLPNAYIVDSGKQTTLGDADDGPNEPFYEACARHHEGEVNNIAELTLSEKNHDNKMEMSFDMHYCAKPFMLKLGTRKVRSGFIIKKTFGETQSLETVSGDECLESSIKVSSDDVPLHIFETSQVDSSVSEEMNLLQDKEDVAGHSETDFGTACNVESHPESSFADVKDLVNETALLTVDEVTVQPSEGSAVEVPSMQESNLDNSNACLSADSASIPENMSNIVGTEYESNLNATMSQSSQIHTMDVIEEIIADARNNKKTLFSAMEYVINLMMQVEDKEKAAQQAKVEAASGGMDIMNKVQELKQMLEYAKKGNNMDAGDVYGEKAILATELRELQSRVLSLSDERDKSLAVLDEMRQTLEVQLAAAENEIRSAEQEKLEKENAARKLFADQELVMEKVVQESKNLKQLAEENANLQEFLTDRGHTVDALQREIASICQDVRLLREKFDLHLPLSESLFPSQTSLVLASSNSPLKILDPDQVQAFETQASSNSPLKSLDPDQVQALPVGDDDLFETQKNRDHELALEEEATEDDRKALEDEGWEFFVDAETV